jgi:septin family protein
VQRSQKHLDTHIHCALYLVDPTSAHYHYSLPYGLDALDIHILTRLSRITTVIPIISKADTCTTARLNSLKSLISQNIRQHNLRLTSFLSEQDSYSEDDEEMEQDETSSQEMDTGDDLNLPLSVLSPDYYGEFMAGEGKSNVDTTGRSYPWGFADALNPNHCDYAKLRELVFVDWRRELRGTRSPILTLCLANRSDYSRQVLYEHWRSNLMRSLTH